MSEALTRKKKVRGGHRTSVKRVISTSQEYIDSDPSKHVVELNQQLATLKGKVETLKILDEEILEACEEENIDAEIEQADVYHEIILEAILRIEAALKQVSVPSEVTQELETPSHSVNQGKTHTVRLPKLELKKFGSDPMAWMPFWDTFRAAIHDNASLKSVDKFNYLKGLLEGEASQAIEGMTLSSENYDDAISVLQSRFGNKQRVINNHMDILVKLSAVNNDNDIKGLRRLYDCIEGNIRGLKALGVQPDSYGTLLAPTLMNKLPHELRLIISREIKEGDWVVDSILKSIGRELKARERAGGVPDRARSNTSAPPPKKESSLPTAAALVAGEGKVGPTCTYCTQPHTSSSCKTVSNISARKQILRKTGRCFICLRKNHVSKECYSGNKCFKCQGQHHISICMKKDNRDCNPPKQGKSANPGDQLQPTTSQTALHINARTPILLQTAKVSVYSTGSPDRNMNVRLILDSGSQRSYIASRVKQALKLPVECRESMIIKTFGDTSEDPTTCESVRLTLKTHFGKDVEICAYSVPVICAPLSLQSMIQAKEKYKHLSGLQLADHLSEDEEAEIDVLIGSDYYWQLVTGAVKRGQSGPTAIHTKLGWVLSGPTEGKNQQSNPSVNLVSNTHVLKCITEPAQPCNDVLDMELRRFWDLESLGISSSEQSVYSEFIDNITFHNGRYEVGLPWKEPRQLLPDNYHTSLGRLKTLLKRLKQEEVLEEYDAVFKEQLEEGIIEIVKDPDSGEIGRVHYLPHHAVIRREKETTKMRIVYDASCKSTGPSLNQCLYTGPPLSQNILDIILRFRSHRTALAGDIEKAFLNVSVTEEDRNVLRFLWVDDVKKEVPNVIVMRFTRVVFGVTSSPFLLNATVNYHIGKYENQDPDFVKKILRALYVDDVSTGDETVEGAYQLYLKAKIRLAEGGFNLRKFVTNSEELRRRIEFNEAQVDGNLNEDKIVDGRSGATKILPGPSVIHEEESYAKTALGNEKKECKSEQKILGVQWNFMEDLLKFDLGPVLELAGESTPTKRNIAAIAAKFYDPLGFLSPVTVQFKLLLQEICGTGLSWDDELTEDMRLKWKKLVASFQDITSVSLERCYFSEIKEEIVSCCIHGFCDASAKAYAAVVYLQIKTSMGSYVKFLASKTRVAPLSVQTIPRLELLSALILARLLTTITNALECEVSIDQIFGWTDSKVALYWVQGVDKEWKQFVQNRVQEIRRLVPEMHWQHCPGKDNPADIPSRGMSVSELANCTMWKNGPSWLVKYQLEAQEESKSSPPPKECAEEMKSKDRKKITDIFSLLVNAKKVELGEIIEYKQFSDFRRLVRVIALVLKFVKILKLKVKGDKKTESEITANDIKEAELHLIKEIQESLVKNNKIESWKREFGLFTDEQGVIRCGGRISHAELSYTAKHPILLDTSHELTKLLILDSHGRVMHNGVKETLTDLRAKYWLIRGRQTVRKVLHRCVVCLKHEGKPYQAPPPPPLPEFRVKTEPAFTFTGLDYAGPLYVKENTSSPNKKVWICLYTCCVTRAVHLEIVPNLTAEAFLRSLRRFTARRGVPVKIVSDNASTFKAAAKEIAEIMKNSKVKQYLAGRKIEWLFNLEKAPWWGGMFERLIKSMKRCLKKNIGSAKLTYEELSTVVAEVELILNSRPLSYLTADDVEEPLTPSHLMYGRRLLNLPDANTNDVIDDDIEISFDDLSKRMKHLSNVLNHFWQRWSSEYLLELREAHRYPGKRTGVKRVAVGDVVIVHDADQPRGFWRLGRVQSLIDSADGQVRGAVVRVKSKKRRPTTLRRPVQRLYPLEIKDGVEDHLEFDNGDAEQEPEDDNESDEDDEQVADEEHVEDIRLDRPYPRRAAAVQADKRRQAWIQHLT